MTTPSFGLERLRQCVRANPTRWLVVSCFVGVAASLLIQGGIRNQAMAGQVSSPLQVKVRKLEASLPAFSQPDKDQAAEQEAPPDASRARELVNQGNALLEARRFQGARAKFRKALKLSPEYPRALSGMVRLAIAQRKGKDAVRYARTLVRRRPAVSANQRLLGDAYESAGNVVAARKSWTIAASLGDAESWQKLRVAAPQCMSDRSARK